MEQLRNLVLNILRGGLWHTTSIERFQGIRATESILPEPDISGHRYNTEMGKEGYPYVRSLGGVSLFDFDNFDADSYSSKYPCSCWATFVPIHNVWASAVWIEIDRQLVSPQLIPALTLLERWKEEKAYRHNIMPKIEAAHIGPLPVTAFKRAFMVREGDVNIHQVTWKTE